MPESSVELNGMTINLIENKTTYDGMAKNPNEMYLVEKDYDLALSLEYIYNSSTGKYDVNYEIEEGSLRDVFSRIENDESYTPRLKVAFIDHYGDMLIVDTVISETQRGLGTHDAYSSFTLQTTRGGGGFVLFASNTSVINTVSFVHTLEYDNCWLYVAAVRLETSSPYVRSYAHSAFNIDMT